MLSDGLKYGSKIGTQDAGKTLRAARTFIAESFANGREADHIEEEQRALE